MKREITTKRFHYKRWFLSFNWAHREAWSYPSADGVEFRQHIAFSTCTRKYGDGWEIVIGRLLITVARAFKK